MLRIIRPHLASVAVSHLVNHGKGNHDLFSLFSVDFISTTAFNCSNNCYCHCIFPFSRDLKQSTSSKKQDKTRRPDKKTNVQKNFLQGREQAKVIRQLRQRRATLPEPTGHTAW